MTEEMKIEELLNSYIDGELSIRQRTEVKRMAANDPNIAKRLKQLQNCRMLVSALPIANAPSYIMENVNAKLKTRKREKETVSISEYRTQRTGVFAFRRVFAAAAMLSIAAVLVIVINMLTPSNIGGNDTPTVADMRFSGKLELKTNDFRAVDSMISRAIEESGMSKSVTTESDTNSHIYNLSCSREGLNKLLNELSVNWNKLDSAELFVDTKTFGKNVEIKEVTPSQITAIVNQTNIDQSIQTAKDIAAINSVNELLQDRGVTTSVREPGLLTIPQPVEVEYQVPTQQEDGEKTVQFRIILSR